MSADWITFEIRYREKGNVFDKEKRNEIEEYILDYAEEAGIESGIIKNHGPKYSRIVFDECFGSIGEFCKLPKDLITEYPDIQFEFHYLEWYGEVGDEVWIYDGKKLYRRAWPVRPADDDDTEVELVTVNGEPYPAPKVWYADEDRYLNPHFIYII